MRRCGKGLSASTPPASPSFSSSPQRRRARPIARCFCWAAAGGWAVYGGWLALPVGLPDCNAERCWNLSKCVEPTVYTVPSFRGAGWIGGPAHTTDDAETACVRLFEVWHSPGAHCDGNPFDPTLATIRDHPLWNGGRNAVVLMRQSPGCRLPMLTPEWSGLSWFGGFRPFRDAPAPPWVRAAIGSAAVWLQQDTSTSTRPFDGDVAFPPHSQHLTDGSVLWAVPARKRRYLASFRGMAHSGKPWDRSWIASLHAPRRRVIAQLYDNNGRPPRNEADFQQRCLANCEGGEDYNNASFVFVVAGDVPASHRFTETLLSGSVPVLIGPRHPPLPSVPSVAEWEDCVVTLHTYLEPGAVWARLESEDATARQAACRRIAETTLATPEARTSMIKRMVERTVRGQGYVP